VSARVLVLMGVSGAGKSFLGQRLSQATGLDLIEGDTFHSPANRKKMKSGKALDDADRWPWLDALAAAASDTAAILTCSALKRSYRDRLRQRLGQEVRFAHLAASPADLAGRMAARQHHFMPVALLDSQLATLEPLQADEVDAIILDATMPADQLLAELHQRGFLPA
jgi:gluconokinase